MDLTGKVAVVTGASAGIGAATVKDLHGIGMKVVGFARRKERIGQLIENHEGRLFAVKVDLTNQQEIIDGFAWVAKNVGPIHVLINNAGTGTRVSIIDGDERIWKTIMYTNFNSVLLCCREAIKNMRENGVDGYIINCMNPGLVKTEIGEAAGLSKEACEERYKVTPHLLNEDIADTIKFLVQSPPHVQISNLTIQPVGENF